MRARVEGVVAVSLTVSAAGSAAGCRVTGSSGSHDLDDATCALLLRRARYAPARDDRGRAVAAVVTRRVRWQIPRDDPEDGGFLFLATKPFAADVEFDVTDAGRIEHCHATGAGDLFGGAPRCAELDGQTLPARPGDAPQGARHVAIHLSSTVTPLGARPAPAKDMSPPN